MEITRIWKQWHIQKSAKRMAMSVPGAAFRQTAKCGTCTPEVCLDFWECTPVLRLSLFIARLVGAMTNNI